MPQIAKCGKVSAAPFVHFRGSTVPDLDYRNAGRVAITFASIVSFICLVLPYSDDYDPGIDSVAIRVAMAMCNNNLKQN